MNTHTSRPLEGPAVLTVRVARKQLEAEGICSFELVHPDGDSLPPFSAGAHIDLQLPGGLQRPYSLCNSPAETHRYQIAVLREAASRGGSVALHDRVHAGDLLHISAPRNAFALASEAQQHLLLAGGIGVTPLLAMAEDLLRRGQTFRLHYAARSVQRLAFRERIASGPLARHSQLHLDDGPPQQRLDLQALLAHPQPGQHLYVCGPTGFIAAALQTARSAGWPEAALHCEHFGAAPAEAGGDRPFEVRLARSALRVQVPAGVSAAQAITAAGVFVPVSCEQGICGTCLTSVLEGQCEHRDQYLDEAEQAAHDQFLPCCSRARGDYLVVDL